MRFESIYFLIFLVFIIHILFRKYAIKRNESIDFSSSQTIKILPKTWKNKIFNLPFWLTIIGIIFLIIALARPQKRQIYMSQPSEGLAIELIIDTSSSMTMNLKKASGSDSRMNITKEIVKDFILGKEGKRGRINDMIGIVTFARYADTRAPLTLSHKMLGFMVDEIDIESRMGEDGTAIGDALALGSARLKMADENNQFKIKSKIIILLTDGGNNCGKYMPIDVAKIAKDWGIKIYSVLIADKDDKKEVLDEKGNKFIVDAETSIKDKTLREVSEITGGKFFAATDGDSLRNIYEEIDSLEKSELKSKQRIAWIEFYQSFLFIGLLSLTLSVFLSFVTLRRIP